MSKFTTPAILKMLPNRKFEIFEDFEYHIGELNSGEVIDVKKGFVTDLASVPRFMWVIFSPIDEYAKAAIVHDFLYSTESGLSYSRQESDNIFLEAMTVLGVPVYRKYPVWLAVRLFGWVFFKKTK